MIQLATLVEIAQKLNMSASTVSRVANEKGNVKEATRLKVLKALEAYGYAPDMTARGLKTGRTHTVGVIVPDISEPFFSSLLCGMEEAISKAQYKLLLCISNEDARKEIAYLKYFAQNRIEGVILATVSPKNNPVHLEFIKNQNIIFIDNLPNMHFPFSAVITDNALASKMAVTYLHSLGHRKIGTIAGKQAETTGNDRLIGYQQTMMSLGLAAEGAMIQIGDFKESSGYMCMTQLLRDVPGLTAVYVASSQMTYGAVKALTAAGKKIPDDISVVGFDVHDPTGLISPGITTLIQQENKMGRISSRLLLDAIEQKDGYTHQKILLPPELVIKQSCRPIPH